MKNKRSAKTLRTLTPEAGISFCLAVRVRRVRSLQPGPVLRPAPGGAVDSIAYHQERGDIAQWIEHTLHDQSWPNTSLAARTGRT